MVKRSSGILRKSSVIFLVLILALLIAGCDPNAEEKEKLTQEMEALKVEIENELEKSNEVLSQLNDCENKISDLEREKVSIEERRTEYQHDLGEYVLDHTMITLSLLAAGGGIAATLEENLDEDVKTILQGLGIVGAVYCILHPTECADVTQTINAYGFTVA